MTKIINNRLLYASHNVVCDPELATMQYMQEMNALLSESGGAAQHVRELDFHNNDGTWTIERPIVELKPFHSSESAERRELIPERIIATVTLFNGSYDHIIHVVHCARSESFQPLWESMYRAGIRIGKLQRTNAETKYFKLYDSAVAAYGARNYEDPACSI